MLGRRITAIRLDHPLALQLVEDDVHRLASQPDEVCAIDLTQPERDDGASTVAHAVLFSHSAFMLLLSS